jgi:hypothetical protein
MQQGHLEVFARLSISPETLRRKVNLGRLASRFPTISGCARTLHRQKVQGWVSALD